ncbi:hypothetical protein GR7B_00083 [Vibrio phage vB_VcorM_GR7B]|nr:hypothetical protein GR7B_00083 [Vibrio phage vB_VcorM_GR7B]
MIKQVTVASATHNDKPIEIAAFIEEAGLIDDLKRGDRVIINDNTTKEPEYYPASVTRLNKKDNLVFIVFDDGIKMSYKATRSLVGLVGKAKIKRKRVSPIPENEINKWLEVAIGKGKRPVGDMKEKGKKDGGKSKVGKVTELPKEQMTKLLKGELVCNPAKLAKGKRIIVRRGKKLMAATVKTYSKATKMMTIALDKGDKTDMVSTNVLVGFIQAGKGEKLRDKAIKPQNLMKWIETPDVMNPIPEPKVDDNKKGGFSVDNESGKATKSPDERGGVYGVVSLDRGKQKICFEGDKVKYIMKGSPAVEVDYKKAAELIRNSKSVAVTKSVYIANEMQDLKSAKGLTAFLKELRKAKPPIKSVPNQRADNITLGDEDEAESIYKKWAKKFGGLAKTVLGASVSASSDPTEAISEYFPKLKREKFKEVGKYFDDSGDIYFLMKHSGDDGTYAVFKTGARSWSLIIMGKTQYQRRYEFMESLSDDFNFKEYVLDAKEDKQASRKKLTKELQRFETSDFQNAMARGTDYVSGLPTEIIYSEVDAEKYPALKFSFMSTPSRVAKNWVSSWLQSRNHVASELRVTERKTPDDDGVEQNWVDITAIWKKA